MSSIVLKFLYTAKLISHTIPFIQYNDEFVSICKPVLMHEYQLEPNIN